MTQSQWLSAIGPSFAEVLALGATEQVEMFLSSHRRAVSGRYGEVVSLTAMEESRAYEAAGCSSVLQLAIRVGDYSKKMVRDLLRVGRTLRLCPELDAAFRSERLSWSKVRTLVPVMTSETATNWIDKAMHVATGTLERMVARQREPEGVPGMAPMPEVAVAALTAFRELCGRLRQQLRMPGMPDGECAGVLFAIAGWALEQHAEEALGALGYADAVPATAAAAAREEVPAETTRGEQSAAGPVGQIADASEPTPHAADASTHDATAHVGRGPSSNPSDQLITEVTTPAFDACPSSRHSRHIPNAVRRAVMARAGYRCEASGCGNRLALDLHHLDLFTHGGVHTPADLVVWCRPCHELWHRFELTEHDET